MYKKLLTLILTATMIMPLSSCGEASSVDMDTTKTTSENVTAEEESKATTKTEFSTGETWEVEGQWRVTVNSVTPTDERNEFFDKEPAAVYVIEYTYENLGYEDEYGLTDGLLVDFGSGQIVDAGKTMGYEYPGGFTNYAEPVPIGASHTAQSYIGVNTAGNFTVKITEYGSDSKKQSATFICNVE